MSDPLAGLRAQVSTDRHHVLSYADKPVPPAWWGRSDAELAESHPFLDEASTPVFTLSQRALESNVAAMAQFAAQHDLVLAPHGKTTMAPALWLAQLEAGAWAITVANEAQLRVAVEVDVPRIIVANELIRPDALVWLSTSLHRWADLEVYCWVDSLAGVEAMSTALAETVSSGAGRPVSVLVELGHRGGRTGVRPSAGEAEAIAVAHAAAASPQLRLAGVASYEGVVAHVGEPNAEPSIDAFLTRLITVLDAIEGQVEIEPPMVSAGGSAWFDRVAAILGPITDRARVVLRSGATLAHDDGIYARTTPAARDAGPALTSAMHVWSRVISIPEAGLAYLDAGKRDLSFDEGLPVPQFAVRHAPAGPERIELPDHHITATNDQHARLEWGGESELALGDVVRLGLSHPCTVFDKWRLALVVDDADAPRPQVVDLIRTWF